MKIFRNIAAIVLGCVSLAACQTEATKVSANRQAALASGDLSQAFLIADVRLNGQPCVSGRLTPSRIYFQGDGRRNVKNPLKPKFNSVRNTYSGNEIRELVPTTLEPDTYSFSNTDCLNLAQLGATRKFAARSGDVISLGVIQASTAGGGREVTVTSRPFTSVELASFSRKYPKLAARKRYVPWQSMALVSN